MDEMLSDECYENCLSAIEHALDVVKINSAIIDYIKVSFLHLIKKIRNGYAFQWKGHIGSN
jgi:hypothetical protein